MSGKKPLNQHLIEESSSEHDLAAIEDAAAELKRLSLPETDIVRIEEKHYVHWSGVSSCDHSDTIQAEVRAALNAWAAQKMYEYRDWRYVQFGAEASTVRCSQSKDPWTGKRSCGCSGTIPFYIEFRKA